WSSVKGVLRRGFIKNQTLAARSMEIILSSSLFFLFCKHSVDTSGSPWCYSLSIPEVILDLGVSISGYV
ncbi:MAG: hypothetical protein ACTIK3_13165, partial [Sphingobacteriaceae bacterium]